MKLHDARSFQPIRHQDDAAKQVANESTDLIGDLDQFNYGKQPLGRWRRRRVSRRMKQRFARILSSGHRRSGTGDAIRTWRDPTMQPPLERGLDGDPMNRLDLDQFEKAFPVAVNPQGPATLGPVQQGPQRAQFSLKGAKRRLVLDDPLAGQFERTFGLRKTLLQHARRFTDGLELAAGGFGGAASPVELLGQGCVSNGPGLELRPCLLLLFTQKLTPTFQLAKFCVDRRGLSLGVVAPLVAGGALRLAGRLCFSRRVLSPPRP